MTFVLPRYSRWLPCYRHGTLWLAAALVCALVLGVCGRISDGLGFLLLLLFGLAVSVWFLAVIISSFRTAWSKRNDLRVVAFSLLTPVASLASFALILTAVWALWGVWPLPPGKTTDFQIDKVLPSPDGAWQAVYSEDLSGGPAVGVSEEVYLIRNRPGTALFSKDRVFSIECIQSFQMRWTGPRTLEIGYLIGDQPPTDGLLSRTPLPLFHDKQDEWRFTDPVKVVEARHIVHGNLC